MPPGPSEPASMPIRRKSSSAGTPRLTEALLARTLRSRRIDAPRSIDSNDISTTMDLAGNASVITWRSTATVDRYRWGAWQTRRALLCCDGNRLRNDRGTGLPVEQVPSGDHQQDGDDEQQRHGISRVVARRRRHADYPESTPPPCLRLEAKESSDRCCLRRTWADTPLLVSDKPRNHFVRSTRGPQHSARHRRLSAAD